MGNQNHHSHVIRPLGNFGFSAMHVILLTAMPKCPLCWMALMTTLGVGSLVGSAWLRPVAIALLVLNLGVLFVRARRLGRYGPLSLGLAASFAMYLCKFGLNYDVGAYLSAATLFGASIWNARQQYGTRVDIRCRC